MDPSNWQGEVEDLGRRLRGRRWNKRHLLHQAFLHTSWTNENRGMAGPFEPYERLEYVGDSVLDLLVGSHLFHTQATWREGPLSQERARRVCASALAERATVWSIGPLIKVGKHSDHIRNNQSILADVVEALVGSAFVDGGLDEAAVVVLRLGII